MIERPRDGKEVIGVSKNEQSLVSEEIKDQTTAERGSSPMALQRPISLLHYDYKSIYLH